MGITRKEGNGNETAGYRQSKTGIQAAGGVRRGLASATQMPAAFFGVMLLVFFICSSLVQAAVAPALQHFIDIGRVPPGVEKQIAQSGQAEVIVTLDNTDVRTQAAAMRKALGVRNNNAEILAEKVVLYRQKKGSVLAGIAGKSYGVLQDYDNLPVMFMRVDAQSLAALLNMKEVRSVSENMALVPFLAESLPLINQPEAESAGATGAGTFVAVVDSGVDYANSAFGTCSGGPGSAGCKVAFQQCFVAGGCQTDDSHGTNVSAIVLGVAPDTEILSLDVFQSGVAYDTDILDALNWVLGEQGDVNSPYHGKIESVNMSLGGTQPYNAPCPNDALAGAITDLKSAGITTAVAAGNDGYTAAISSPACVPDAVSVGAVYDSNVKGLTYPGVPCTDATTAADQVTCFSNSASILTMLAPGAIITAAGISMTGTSQATPFVSGAAAVIKGQYGSLTVDDVVSSMTGTGVLITDPRNSITKPRLDLYAALLAAGPNVSVSPASKDFGTVFVGGSASQTFTISNSGMSDLAIQTLSIAGTSASEFSLGNDLCSSQTLGPGGSCTADVSFAPQSAGGKGADLSVPSDDPDTPALSVSLTGSAVIPLYALTVAKSGTGTGTVTSSPAGIDCGSACSGSYDSGTAVTLTANPGTYSTFSGWSGGGCSGPGTCQVTMTGDISVTATFTMTPPAASFSSTTTTGAAPFYVSFTDTSTNGPSSWLWDFGDGGTSTAQNPSYNYKKAGTYTVTLTATNAGGSSQVIQTDLVSVSACSNATVRLLRGGSPTDYTDLATAVGDAVADGDIVEAQALEFTGDLVFGNGVAVTLNGGYGCDYQTNPAATTVNGALTVTSGTLTVDNVIIQ